MYCKNCGKQISENATACPDCGEPTNMNGLSENSIRSGENMNAHVANKVESGDSFPLVGFVLSIVSIVLAVFVVIAFFYSNNSFVVFLSALALLFITLSAFILGLIGLYCTVKSKKRVNAFSLTAVILSSVVLLLLFICMFIFMQS